MHTIMLLPEPGVMVLVEEDAWCPAALLSDLSKADGSAHHHRALRVHRRNGLLLMGLIRRKRHDLYDRVRDTEPPQSVNEVPVALFVEQIVL